MSTPIFPKPEPEYRHRASGMDLEMICAESSRIDGVRVSEPNETANEGTCLHEIMACRLSLDRVDEQAETLIAEQYGLELTDIGWMAGVAWKLWNEGDLACGLQALQTYFLDKEVEAPLSARLSDEFKISCTADLLSRKQLIALDWKFGHKDRPNFHQAASECYALMQGAGEITADRPIMFITVWARLGRYEIMQFTRADLDRWAETVLRNWKNGKGVFRPGEHCSYCSRQETCPGRAAQLESAVTALAPVITMAIEGQEIHLPMPHEQLYAVDQTAKRIIAACEVIRKTVNSRIWAEGAVDLGGGRAWGFVEQNAPAEISPLKAWPILQRYLKDEHIAKAMRLSKPKLLAAVRAYAPAGQKKILADALVSDLESVGAITQKKHGQLKIAGKEEVRNAEFYRSGGNQLEVKSATDTESE